MACLFDIDLGPERLMDLLFGDLFYFHAVWGLGDPVDLGDFKNRLDDEISAAVSVAEDGDILALTEFKQAWRGAGAVHGDRVLEAVVEQVDDISSAFDDDELFALFDCRSCGQAFASPFDDFLDAYGCRDFSCKLLGVRDDAFDEVLEQLLCPLDDVFAFGDSD